MIKVEFIIIIYDSKRCEGFTPDLNLNAKM